MQWSVLFWSFFLCFFFGSWKFLPRDSSLCVSSAWIAFFAGEKCFCICVLWMLLCRLFFFCTGKASRIFIFFIFFLYFLFPSFLVFYYCLLFFISFSLLLSVYFFCFLFFFQSLTFFSCFSFFFSHSIFLLFLEIRYALGDFVTFLFGIYFCFVFSLIPLLFPTLLLIISCLFSNTFFFFFFSVAL